MEQYQIDMNDSKVYPMGLTQTDGGITACVLPFIPTAIIKAVLACAIGLNLRKRIPGLKA